MYSIAFMRIFGIDVWPLTKGTLQFMHQRNLMRWFFAWMNLSLTNFRFVFVLCIPAMNPSKC